MRWCWKKESLLPEFPSPPQVASQIAAAQERLKANPQDIAALVELGTLKFEKGRDSYVEAIGDLEEARDLGALDARIFYCLGIMYQEEGLFPFALTEYKRFLRHYPEDKEVRMLTAKLYYKMGLFSEAVNEYDRLKFQDPSDPLIEENLGMSLWGRQAHRPCLRLFRPAQNPRRRLCSARAILPRPDRARGGQVPGSLRRLRRGGRPAVGGPGPSARPDGPRHGRPEARQMGRGARGLGRVAASRAQRRQSQGGPEGNDEARRRRREGREESGSRKK